MLARPQEHFLFIRQPAENRQPSALVLTIGGPFEGSPSDAAWQTWALQACNARGLSFFYDGLNPRSGVGGHSPFEASQLAIAAKGGLVQKQGRTINISTGGIMLPDWQVPPDRPPLAPAGDQQQGGGSRPSLAPP